LCATMRELLLRSLRIESPVPLGVRHQSGFCGDYRFGQYCRLSLVSYEPFASCTYIDGQCLRTLSALQGVTHLWRYSGVHLHSVCAGVHLGLCHWQDIRRYDCASNLIPPPVPCVRLLFRFFCVQINLVLVCTVVNVPHFLFIFVGMRSPR
jgi:hypothetical protein